MSQSTHDQPPIRLHPSGTTTNDRMNGQQPRDTSELPYTLPLELTVHDRETIEALWKYEEGEPRERFALEALKLGTLALRQASGVLDASLVQREAANWMESIHTSLESHAEMIQNRLASTLKEYFDPESGRFSERVQRLVADDGELQQVLRKHIAGDDSQLTKTLVKHVGEGSSLLKLLHPKESDGLFSALSETIDGALKSQRDRLLSEFSLDQEESSLSRLVRELTKRHGKLEEGISEKINEVVKEFSLDEENSALNRLVKNVTSAQQTITNEFSLDNEASAFSRMKEMLEKTQGTIQANLTLDDENSPLARLKKELHDILALQDERAKSFQEEVKVALGNLVATRKESERGVRHGHVFEEAVCEYVIQHAQAQGDMAYPTGHMAGLINRCKVGDCIIELGPDSAAPGTKIVIEAKEDKSYRMTKAMNEMETARKNRGAAVGMFIFSEKAAPPHLNPLFRHGSDVYVTWNAENPDSDAFLKGGLLVAKALCLQQGRKNQSRKADFEAMEKAVLEIENQAARIDKITTKATTIQNASEEILTQARLTKKAFSKQVESLRDHFADLEASLKEGEAE